MAPLIQKFGLAIACLGVGLIIVGGLICLFQDLESSNSVELDRYRRWPRIPIVSAFQDLIDLAAFRPTAFKFVGPGMLLFFSGLAILFALTP